MTTATYFTGGAFHHRPTDIAGNINDLSVVTHTGSEFGVNHSLPSILNGYSIHFFAAASDPFTYSGADPTGGSIETIEVRDNSGFVYLRFTGPFTNNQLATFWTALEDLDAQTAFNGLLGTSVQTGSSAADSMSTYGFSTHISGLGGADLFDILHGGSLADPTTVQGGDGQDIITIHGEAFPFSGNNHATLDGGAQNDVFHFFGSIVDTVIVNGGTGFDRLFIENGGLNPQSMSGIEAIEFGDVSITAKYALLNDSDLSHNGLKIALDVKGSAHDTGGNQLFIGRVGNTAANLDFSAVTVSNFLRINQTFEFTLANGPETVARNDVVVGVRGARNIFSFNLGADNATGGNRDDVFWGGALNDFFSGGLGSDEARYNLGPPNYAITMVGENRYTVRDTRPVGTSGHEGTDTLVDVEKVLFGFNGPQADWFTEFVTKINSSGAGATASVTIPENQKFAVDVNATDGNTALSGAQHQDLTYQISGGLDAAKFVINPTTGIINFLSAPDFETPTDSNKDNIYRVVVRVLDGMLYDQQTIDVHVTNVAGVTITGNADPNVINQTTSPAGQPKPTVEADVIKSGGAADDITGLGGRDQITPGTGADIVRYLSPTEGGDTIIGWESTDRLFFKSAVFGNVGAITATNFATNTSGQATTLQHRFIFDSDDLTLFWDPDGTGGASRVPIATFGNDPGLNGGDMLFF